MTWGLEDSQKINSTTNQAHPSSNKRRAWKPRPCNTIPPSCSRPLHSRSWCFLFLDLGGSHSHFIPHWKKHVATWRSSSLENENNIITSSQSPVFWGTSLLFWGVYSNVPSWFGGRKHQVLTGVNMVGHPIKPWPPITWSLSDLWRNKSIYITIKLWLNPFWKTD